MYNNINITNIELLSKQVDDSSPNSTWYVLLSSVINERNPNYGDRKSGLLRVSIPMILSLIQLFKLCCIFYSIYNSNTNQKQQAKELSREVNHTFRQIWKSVNPTFGSPCHFSFGGRWWTSILKGTKINSTQCFLHLPFVQEYLCKDECMKKEGETYQNSCSVEISRCIHLSSIFLVVIWFWSGAHVVIQWHSPLTHSFHYR